MLMFAVQVAAVRDTTLQQFYSVDNFTLLISAGDGQGGEIDGVRCAVCVRACRFGLCGRATPHQWLWDAVGMPQGPES